MTLVFLTFMILKEKTIQIAANIYERPNVNNVPIGPSQIAIIEMSFESPFPIASFL